MAKLKTVNNAIDILNDIIGDDFERVSKTVKPTVAAEKSPKSEHLDISPTRLTQEIFDNLNYLFPEANISECSFDTAKNSAKSQFNYIHYDPQMHWCKDCDRFPKTADEYLKHLHSKEHEKNANSKIKEEAPWHLRDSSDDELPNNSQGDIKRLPFRGLQHIVPVPAWFCKLCNKWMGDLHCAFLHLKSKTHFNSYTSFLEQNPHWEIDWLSERQKKYENKILNKEKILSKPSTKIQRKARDSSSDLGLSPERFRKRTLSSSSKSRSDSDSCKKKTNYKSEKPKSSKNSFVISTKTAAASRFDSEKYCSINKTQRNFRKYKESSDSESDESSSQTDKSKIWNLVDSMYNKSQSTIITLEHTASNASDSSLAYTQKKLKNKVVSSSSETERWMSDNEDSKKLTDKVSSISPNNLKTNKKTSKWIPIGETTKI